MNSLQLSQIAKSQARFHNLKIVPYDLLPTSQPKATCLYIVNTLSSHSNKSMGHWFLLYLSHAKNIQFCSFAADYTDILPAYININLICNTFQYQNFTTVTCGHYCIYTAWYLSEQRRNYKRTFESVLDDFCIDNYNYNDILVYEFVKNKFGVITEFSLDDYNYELF